MDSRRRRSEGSGSRGGYEAGQRQDVSRYSRSNYGRTAVSGGATPGGVKPARAVGQRGPGEARTGAGRFAAGSVSASKGREGKGRANSLAFSHKEETPLTAEEFHRQYSRGNDRYSAKEARKSGRGKKIAVGVLCSLLVVLIGCGAAFAMFVNKVDQELSGNKTAEEQEAIQGALADRANSTDPFYMLLLGSDEREGDDEMGARSDTAIVARIDPKHNQVTLISIPRDTKIVYKGSTIKFNAAYFYGGTAGSITAASELLGVPISHYAEVSFDSLTNLVDAVGGVEVDVPKRINDRDAGSVVIEEGLQTLDGEAALVFARSRAYADGDFTRTSNQRLLIEALASKVLSLPVDQMPGVIESAAQSVTTDLSLTGILSLAMEFVDDDGELTIYSIMVPSTFDSDSSSTYVIAEKDGLRKMMEIVEQGGDPNSVETYGATGSMLKSS